MNSRKKRSVETPPFVEETTLRNAKVSGARRDIGGTSDSLARRNEAGFGDTSDEKVTSPQLNRGHVTYLREVSAPFGRRVARSELRWSGEDRRSAGSRQEELKVTSSTFALTGDSSHNQAMVHWSGQNSSVSR